MLHKLGAVLQTQFVFDVLAVSLDGLDTQVQLPRDLPKLSLVYSREPEHRNVVGTARKPVR